MIYRELQTCEYGLLKDYLYEAIHIPEGAEPPDRSIIELPELAVYYEDFGGRPADRAIAAEDEGIVAGIIWSRIMNDYGHVDDDTPSLAMSVLKRYRGRGTGTVLLKMMLDRLAEEGYKRVSLSVQKANQAVRLYERAGFITLSENTEEYIMVCYLSEDGDSKTDH